LDGVVNSNKGFKNANASSFVLQKLAPAAASAMVLFVNVVSAVGSTYLLV
jgi:hypothetical protein